MSTSSPRRTTVSSASAMSVPIRPTSFAAGSGKKSLFGRYSPPSPTPFQMLYWPVFESLR